MSKNPIYCTRLRPAAETDTEKKKEQEISGVLTKVSGICNGHVKSDGSDQTSDGSDQTDQITFLHLDQSIFNWSNVRTDFEYFSTFLPLLKQSHVFNQSSAACTDHRMRFKHLLWTLFSGFAHKPTENLPHHTELDKLFKTEAIAYYKSILQSQEQDLYRTGSFIERFKLLGKITKICPVRLNLLGRLHESLKPDNKENSPSDTRTYRLSATIIIDRHLKQYCRLRACVINKEFETSHLTRLPDSGEESFLRVSLGHTSMNAEAAWQLAKFDKPDDFSSLDPEINSAVHNLSALVNIMHDLLDTANCHSELTKKVESALEKDNVDQMNKPLKGHLIAKWCTSGFDPLEESVLIQSSVLKLKSKDDLDSDNTGYVSSLKIAGKRFKYLMTTSSGVHKNVHIFSVVKYDELCKSMFSSRYLEKLMKIPMKMSLRMGLWFTPTISMNEEKVPMEKQEDIGKHTDGCGRVSVFLAKKMSKRWREGRKYKNVPFVAQNVGPTEWNAGVLQDSEIEYTHDESSEQMGYYSAFQVRLGGIKGMFVVDQSLGEGERIVVSKSQVKFRSPDNSNATIEMVQCSEATSSARLNFALISLIVGCSKDPQLMETYFTNLALKEKRELLENRASAIKFAVKHNDVKSFNMLGAGCSLLETFLAGYYQNYARRFKFVVEHSRRLFGVADFWKVLKKGEVFVKISNLRPQASMRPSIKEQRVLVTKEPCFHRGDLRTFTAVTEKELEQRPNGKFLVALQDVVVFSCVEDEERSEPDKICGSDLDGDQYFVCWDDVIVENLKDSLFEPGDFNAIVKVELDKITKEDIEDAARKLNERLKNKSERLKNKNENMSGEPIDLESPCPVKRKLIRYHVDGVDYSYDFENKVHALGKCENAGAQSEEDESVSTQSEEDESVSTQSEEDESVSTQSDEDVEKKSTKLNGKLKKTQRCAAETAMEIITNSRHLTIHDTFDVHMRWIDSLGDKWTEDEKWKSIEELCQCISMVIDSAKSGIMTFKKPLTEDLWSLFEKLPAYPHFHPRKRKDECRRSNSALGGIYDSLQEELKKDLPESAKNTDQTSFDTLHDKISELKLSFLSHYTTSQCNSHTEDTTESSHSFHENSHTDDSFFEPMLPNLNIDKIKMWYNEDIKSLADKDLLRTEAACTMLWKLIILLKLKNVQHCNLKILYLDDEKHLSDTKYEDLFPDGETDFPFFCITKRLLEDLDLVSSTDFSKSSATKTLFLLKKEEVEKLINSLEALMTKTFWRDLQLPYPNAFSQTRALQLKSGLSPITFNQLLFEFERQIQECLQKSVSMPLSEGWFPRHHLDCDKGTYTIGKNKADASVILSKLRDIVGYLLCFSEVWKESPKSLSSICQQLSRVAFYHIRMYKYQKTLSNQQIDQSYFPTCYWDRYRIDLSKLEMADDEMNKLFKILYS